MRFLLKEQKEIVKLINQYDLRDAYMFVKRKGWVYIEFDGKSFGFHRKETSKLINGILEQTNKYFIRLDKKDKPVESFNPIYALGFIQ